ncbi:TPA: 16S rRNA methyltransferase, partial [Pseudomonas aeruginosa]
MDPRSEVLLRQRHLFATPLLLAGLPADDLLAELPQAQGWSWHAGEQAQLDARFPGRSRFDTRAPIGAWTSAVLFLPKSRELTDYLLASLAARLPGGELFLVGEKRGGIERASKQLAAYGKPRKLDSARHCQLWQVRIEQAPAEPDLHALAQRYSLPLADGELQVVSLPGVFSHGRLDRG